MMVLYDMFNSLKSVEKADSSIHQLMEYQLQIAEDPSRFDTMKFQMARLVPVVDFTETTERIFSSSIETINTIGNVLFTENVAEFYQIRQLYKTNVCDSILNDLKSEMSFDTLKGTLDFSYVFYSILSGEILLNMQQLFTQCKNMMNITDEQIEAYQKKKKKMEEGMSDKEETMESIYNRVNQLQERIDDAKGKCR